MDKKEILAKLMNNSKVSIPRNSKLLKKCCKEWLFENEYPFELKELYEFCDANAALNGQNAFMRSLISSLLDCQDTAAMDKFFNFVIQNDQEEWVNKLMGNICFQIDKTDHPFKQRFVGYFKR